MFDSYGVRTSLDEFGAYGSLLNGGKGSGDFGHYGRPGEVGGSASSGSPIRTKAKRQAYLDGGGKLEDATTKKSDEPTKEEKKRVYTDEMHMSEKTKELLNSEQWSNVRDTLNDEIQKVMVEYSSEMARDYDPDGIDPKMITFDIRKLRARVLAEAGATQFHLKADFDKIHGGEIASWDKDKSRKERSWTADSTMAGTIRHELGHTYNMQQQKKWEIYGNALLYYAYAKTTGTKKMGESAWKADKKAGKIPISKYGLTSIQETFAESFSNRKYSKFANDFVENFKKATEDLYWGNLDKSEVYKNISAATKRKWYITDNSIKSRRDKMMDDIVCVGYFDSEKDFDEALRKGEIDLEEE